MLSLEFRGLKYSLLILSFYKSPPTPSLCVFLNPQLCFFLFVSSVLLFFYLKKRQRFLFSESINFVYIYWKLMSTSSMISNRRNIDGEQECGSEILHVLAVDDSLIDRKLVERLLKSSSYRVTTVDSGKRALELLGLEKENSVQEEQKINMIITDYCMPEMTGFDLLKRVKESSTLREIPVVIMSSENVPTRITRCMEEGAEEFLLKPLQKSDVPKLHNHMMRGNQRLGHGVN